MILFDALNYWNSRGGGRCLVIFFVYYVLYVFFAVFTVFSNIRTFLTLSNSSVTEIHNTFGHFNFTKFFTHGTG